MFLSDITEIDVSLVPGRNLFVLREEIRYRSRWHLEILTTPAGRVTDFASVPRLLWAVFPPHGRYAPAAALHDELYRRRYGTRLYADLVFLDAMREVGVGRVTRGLLFAAVRCFGFVAWWTTSDLDDYENRLRPHDP